MMWPWGPDVIEPGSVGEPERLSEEQIRQEMERAVRQGADPAFVKRTQGWPGVMGGAGHRKGGACLRDAV